MLTQLTEEEDILAGEFALGVLDGNDKARAQEMANGEAMFADAVRRWRNRYASMVREDDPSLSPIPWIDIAARLPAIEKTVPGGGLGRRWPAAVAGSLFIAMATLATMQFLPKKPPLPVRQQVAAKPHYAPPLIGTLTGKGVKAAVTIRFDPATGKMLIIPTGLDLADHDAELWVTPTNGPRRSMGLIDAGRPEEIATAPALRGPLLTGGMLAISMEPKGGSSMGEPTGKIILTGTLKPL